MMRVVVTGSAGFIGRNLLDAIPDDWQVIGVDEKREGNACDLDYMTWACQDADALVHLAANPGVVKSMEDPVAHSANDVFSTIFCLEACRINKVKRFIFASSGSIFSPLFTPYSASKHAGEAYTRAYHNSYGLNVTILRLGNVYGPHSMHKESVVSTFIRQVLAGQPMTVRGDGNQTRSFIYVKDVVDSILRSLADYEGSCPGSHEPVNGYEVLHITSNDQVTITQLAHTIGLIYKNLTHRSASIKFIDSLHEADSVKIRSSIMPSVSLTVGLEETFKWFRSLQ